MNDEIILFLIHLFFDETFTDYYELKKNYSDILMIL